MKLSIILLLVLGTSLVACATKEKAKKTSPIKHVVVLMMENRAFDHMLGWMTRGGPNGDVRVDGLYGSECNPIDLSDMEKVLCVDDEAVDITVDPPHSIEPTTEEVFACKEHFVKGVTPTVPGYENDPCKSHASTTGNPTMLGFIDTFRRSKKGKLTDHPLKMWKPEKLPILTTLAKEFALFDRFFPSHPGPTDPNRMFMHTGTARGNTNTGECRVADVCCP